MGIDVGLSEVDRIEVVFEEVNNEDITVELVDNPVTIELETPPEIQVAVNEIYSDVNVILDHDKLINRNLNKQHTAETIQESTSKRFTSDTEIDSKANQIDLTNHINDLNNPHETGISNLEGFPTTPTLTKFLRDDKTFAEIALRHSQLILPNEDVNVQHLTDSEKAELHTHINKSVLDTITSVLVSGWNAAATWVSTYGANVLTHISDGSLHVTQALLNTISNKVDKVEGKGLSTNDFTNEQKELLSQQSGVNTGDQDLSGLESKRGTDDFYVTNAEKTQGALATGNTALPTVRDVADRTDRLLVDFIIPSDTNSITINVDKYANPFSYLDIKALTIVMEGYSYDDSQNTVNIGINNLYSELAPNKYDLAAGSYSNGFGFTVRKIYSIIADIYVNMDNCSCLISNYRATSKNPLANTTSMTQIGNKFGNCGNKITEVKITRTGITGLFTKGSTIKIYRND